MGVKVIFDVLVLGRRFVSVMVWCLVSTHLFHLAEKRMHPKAEPSTVNRHIIKTSDNQ